MSAQRKRIAISAGPWLNAWEAEAALHLNECPLADVVGWWSIEAKKSDGAKPALPAALERAIRASARFTGTDARGSLSGIKALAAPANADADIVLHLGGSEPAAPPHHAQQRHWVFRHPDGAAAAHFPPGVREALLGERFARLQLVDAGNGLLLKECCLPADDDYLAVAEAAVAQAIHWPRERLADEALDDGKLPGITADTERPLPTPNGWHLLRRAWQRWLGRGGHPVLDESGPWNIGVLYQPIHVLLNEVGSRNVRWLPDPSKGKSRMEPFGYLDADGDLNALYRKGDMDGFGGAIARVRPKVDNILKRSRSMLDDVENAGYPFVASVRGVVHAVITDSERQEVRLRPVSSDNASLDAGVVILRDALHAPTLFEHDGHWWLLGTRDPWPEAMLHAYHATSPHGPFTEHARSPIKCDARHARPAGTPFIHEGLLYRPALDCSDPLRPAVWINRVDILSAEAFHEAPVRRINAFPATAYGQGVRTISAIGDLTLVDGLKSPVLEGAKANASRDRKKSRERRKP